MKKTLVRRSFLSAMVFAPATAVTAKPSCVVDAETVQRLKDWPNLKYYAKENAKRIAAGKRNDVIFMGDSITEFWFDERPDFFGISRICRGISGQTSPQMVLRMMADVVALSPRAVHIMAGTNDIAGNTGPITTQQTIENFAAMIAVAKAHNIVVLVGSIPPAGNFIWHPGLETAQTIARTNQRLAALAAKWGAVFVDYTSALATPSGAMKPGYAYDGVHPSAAGYAAMESTLEPFLQF